jgi:dihydrolipoamide dehydrogenase
VAEAMLAIDLGADAHDLGLTVHAQPTLSETLAFAAEPVTASSTDLLPPRNGGSRIGRIGRRSARSRQPLY